MSDQAIIYAVERIPGMGWGLFVNSTKSPDLPAGESLTLCLQKFEDKAAAVNKAIEIVTKTEGLVYVGEPESLSSKMMERAGVSETTDLPASITDMISLYSTVKI